MPIIKVLPHAELCPNGAELQAHSGENLLNLLLKAGIDVEHACEKSCACTTCHLIIRSGFDSLAESSENEDDMLDKAWGLEPNSRLGCQVKIGDKDLTVELPKYTINQVSENH